MTTQYKLQKDVAGYNGFGLPVSDQKFSATLATTTDTTLDCPLTAAMGVPSFNQKNRFLAIIQVTDAQSVWFALNASAEVPAGASFAATTSELIVGGEYFARECQAGDVLHFFTAGTNVAVSVVFYAMQAA